MRKEYCYKVIFSSEYILYIGYVFGKYHVFATNENHSFNYSVYGGYTRIGDASRRLTNAFMKHRADGTGICSAWYMSKDLFLKNGAFNET